MTEELEPGIRRLIAPNPSPMTERGTNTYLVGTDALAVIDPGPDSSAHLDAILRAVGGARVEAILVTHAHLDHSPLAARLARETGAPVLAYGDARSGRSPAMARLGPVGGGEGVDIAFAPDTVLGDGEVVTVGGTRIEALWTPGHFGNHLSFMADGAAFCGDLVMGWASSLVSPPDGDLTDFMASCRRLRDTAPRVLYPGHGDPVAEPAARIDWLIAHRETREAQVLDAVETREGTARALAERIYTDTPDEMLPAAARNVLAHLIDLHGRGLVRPATEIAPDTVFRRA